MIDAAALAAWNAANRKAREEYYAHPLVSDRPAVFSPRCPHCRAVKRNQP